MRVLKRLPIHPTFYLFVLWFLLCGQILEFLTFLLALSLHEYAHFFVAQKCGYTLDKFYIAPYGASLTYKEKQFERSDEIKITLAGPCANLCSAFLLVAIWWVFPISFSYTKLFVEESLFLGLFNLLPAYPLDGGRVVASLLSNKIGRERAITCLKFCNIVFSLCCLVLFAISIFVNFNPTLALLCVFLLLSVFDGEYSGKYKLSFVLKKKIKNFSKPKHLLVQEDVPLLAMLKKIECDSYVIFDIITKNGKIEYLTENELIEYCLKSEKREYISQICKKD